MRFIWKWLSLPFRWADCAFKAAWHRIGMIPSHRVAASYFGMIVLYAYAFTWIPKDFYHSTAKYEPAFNEEAVGLLRDLEELIQNNFEECHGADSHVINGLHIRKDTLNTSRLTCDEAAISFDLSLQTSRPGLGIVTRGRIRVSFPLGLHYMTVDPETGEREFFKPLTVTNHSGLRGIDGEPLVPVNAIFPHCRPFPRVTVEGLWIPYETWQQCEAFSRGLDGFPSELETGHFSRMFYLSAATITTLGYGDVVPITPRARLLVASEAIMGLVLIGVFLNSLASEIGQSVGHTAKMGGASFENDTAGDNSK